jgi:hypothetical protein
MCDGKPIAVFAPSCGVCRLRDSKDACGVLVDAHAGASGDANGNNRPTLDERGVRHWMPNSTVTGATKTHRASDRYNFAMLTREHFVDLFRCRLYHLTFVVLHF